MTIRHRLLAHRDAAAFRGGRRGALPALCLVLLLLTLGQAFAIDFPALTGRVVDEAAILSPSAERQMTDLLAAHEARTTNQVVVATVKSLQGNTIEDYGYQLGRHWGIGQKDRNNGLLLIVAPNERRVRIEVGYGLEGQMTDAASSTIINQLILPEFRAGRMEQGVIAGARAILGVLEGDAAALPPPQKAPETAAEEEADWPVVAMIVLFIIIFLILQRYNSVHGGRRGLSVVPPPYGGFGGGFGGGGGDGGGGGGFGGGGGGFGGGGGSGGW